MSAAARSRTEAFTKAAASAHAHRATGRRGDPSTLVAAVKAAREHSAPVRQVLSTHKRSASTSAETDTPALFAGARPISDLLTQFRRVGADETIVMPPSSSSASASAASAPHAHPLTEPDLTAHDHRLFTTIIAERVLDMAKRVAAATPDPSALEHYVMDAAHVHSVMCEPYGTFGTCISNMCVGRSLSGGYALMQYVTPRQLARYHATGVIPRAEEQTRMCYLCILEVIATAADLCVSSQAGGRTLQVPFFHLVNAPGGYVPEAMHASTRRQPSGGVTHPFRRVDLTDYVAHDREVWIPAQFEAGEVAAWQRRVVRGYGERATLLYNAAHRVPAVSTISAPVEVIAVSASPPCESILAAKLLPSGGVFAPIGVSVEHLDRVAVTQFHLPPSPSVCKTLGGRPVAPVEVFATPSAVATPADVTTALSLCPLPEARARLLAMVAAEAGDWQRVARRYTLLPTLFRTVPMDAAAAIERDYAFLRHLVLYLLLARINELSRLLAAVDTTPVAAREQLIDYLSALGPLLEFYRDRMARRLAVEDTVLWDDTVAWLDLAPAPKPTYYTAADLLASTPPAATAHRRESAASVIAAACKRLPRAASGGAGEPYNAAVFGCETLTESAACLAALPQPADTPYWRPSADLFWVTSLSSTTAVTLPQLLRHADEQESPGWTGYFDALNTAIDDGDAHSTLWRAVVARVNHACLVLAWVTHRLGELDEAVAAAASRVDAWLPSDWKTELARRVQALVASHPTAVNVDQLESELADMPALDAEVEQALVEARELTVVAQALKQYLASHVPLITAAVRARAVTDDEVEPLLPRLNACTPGGLVLGTLCDETLRSMSACVDAIEFLADTADASVYTWVMQAVMPTSAHVSDFVARHRQAMRTCAEYEEYACQLLYASLVGLYPHARNVATFDAWLRYSWLLVESAPEERSMALNYYFGELEAPSPTGDRVESQERLFFLALREHFVRTVALAPAYRLSVLAQYLSFARFEDNTVYHCENLRTLASDGNLSACNVFTLASYVKNAQPWSTYHRPLPRFAAFLAECCRSIDLDLAIDACISAQRPLTADELRPDKDMIRAVGAYVERMCAPAPFAAQWLADIGVSEASARFISGLYHEYKAGALNASSGVARLSQLAHRAPVDYTRVSVFFWTLSLHTRRHVVALDADITAKQTRALAEVQHMAGVEHVGKAVLSTVQCCAMMRTFTVQDNSNFSGTAPVRLNLDTSRVMCVSKRGKAYSSSRPNDREHNVLAMQAAMRAYHEYDARLITPEEREAGRNELKLRRESMRDRVRAYVQTLSKARYTLCCDETEVISYPAVGYVIEQRDDRGIGGDSCTVCPRCGSMTAYSAGMFSANMFTCGACEYDLRAALVVAHEERCALCSMTKAFADRSAKTLAIMDNRARDATYMVFDDAVVAGAHIARRVWVCSSCNGRWVPGAVKHFTLSELRYLCENKHMFNSSLTELLDPVTRGDLIREVGRSRIDPAIPVPRPGATSELPRPAPKPKRRVGNHMV